MRPRRKPSSKLAPALIVLGVSLLLGVYCAGYFKPFLYNIGVVPQDQFKPDTDNALQKYFLVLIVNSLTARAPRLEGLWLLNYSPDHRQLVPMAYQLNNVSGRLLADAFRLGFNHQPSLAFLQAAHQQDLHWHGYILLDEGGLEHLRAAMPNAPTTATASNSPVYQALVFEAFCTQLAQGAKPLDLKHLLRTNHAHVRTSFSGPDLASLNGQLANGQIQSCELAGIELVKLW